MDAEQEKDKIFEITEIENFGYTLASPLDRLGAVIVESIIIYLPLSFIIGDNNSFYNGDVFDVFSIIIQAGVSALQGAIFYSLWSGNLGHKILGLKVISALDGSDQKNAGKGAIREVLKNFLGIFVLPSIWLLWDPKKQNLYDKITKTLVVKSR